MRKRRSRPANTAQMRDNKMGHMPVGKLLFQIAFPIILSMLIQAMYNIVDSIYVSRINEQALTAVSLVFPMQMLLIAVAVGTNVGINALLSRALGAKQFDHVRSIAQHAVFLIVVSYIVMALLLFLVAPLFIGLQTNDPQIYTYGVTYMRIIGLFSLGLLTEVCMEKLLTATGKTIFTMIIQASGAIINIILDPILIFGLGPFPEMGVAGAATATVIGQSIAAIIGIVFNLVINKEIQLTMRGFRPQKIVIGEIYRIAVPSIVLQSIGSILIFAMNLILMQFLQNPTAAAVFGVYFKLNSVFFMPIFGLNNGVVPIVAYNYGARHRKRILDTTRVATITAIIILGLGMTAFWLIPDKLLLIFNASEHMLSIGVPALRIISISFMMAGYNIIRLSTMQALGSAFYSMIVSLARQLFILLPSAFILAAIFRSQGGLPAIWYSFVIAEAAAMALTWFLFSRVRRKKVDPLPE